jgi:hypothetical protein
VIAEGPLVRGSSRATRDREPHATNLTRGCSIFYIDDRQVLASALDMRPLALDGWLPCWDVERRHVALDDIVAWTLAKLRGWGVAAGALSAIDMSGMRAIELARMLTRESLAPALRRPLHAALRALLPELPWDRILVQTYAHFRILVPADEIAPVPPHVDYGFGHALDERNVWLALTDASGCAALHLCTLQESLAHLTTTGVVEGVLAPPPTFRPVPVRCGDAVLFTPLHIHGARPPIGGARVSVDLRIVPAGSVAPGPSFSPPLGAELAA